MHNILNGCFWLSSGPQKKNFDPMNWAIVHRTTRLYQLSYSILPVFSHRTDSFMNQVELRSCNRFVRSPQPDESFVMSSISEQFIPSFCGQ
jgi:hypothetical protein